MSQKYMIQGGRARRISKAFADRQLRNQLNRERMAAIYGSTYHVDPVPTGKAAERIKRKAERDALAWKRKRDAEREAAGVKR